MKLTIRHLFVWVMSVSIVTSLLATGCNRTITPITPEPTENETQVYTTESAPTSSLEATLSILGSPVLGQPIQVTATFGKRETSQFTAENTTACIILPDGFELVSGKLDWQGDLLPGTKHEITATIKAIKYGDWRIEAKAWYFPNEHDSEVGYAYLYALVYPDSATISEHPSPPPERPRATPTYPTEEPPGWTPNEGDIPPHSPAPEEPKVGDNITQSSPPLPLLRGRGIQGDRVKCNYMETIR